MNTLSFLREVTRIPGLPGHERKAAEYIADAFRPHAAEVSIDRLNSVTARVGDTGPRVMVAAHLDEIGLVVRQIEADGSLRVTGNGGVDPRILPAAEVTVWAKSGPLQGIVGAKAPHLLTAADRKKAVQMADVHVDLGLSPERVQSLVRVGDMVQLTGPVTELANGRLASKTLDDRASVAAMLVAAEELNRLKFSATALFVSTAQEEVGAHGARTSGHRLAPDFAIAIDVTHGAGPGTGKWEAHPLDKPVIDRGPSLHRGLTQRLRDTAKQNGIDINLGVSSGATYTDADPLHLVREGVPTVLISIPLRYMHTTVETLDSAVIEACGRLIALFIRDIAEDWGNIEWY